jgi:hypothetical protein
MPPNPGISTTPLRVVTDAEATEAKLMDENESPTITNRNEKFRNFTYQVSLSARSPKIKDGWDCTPKRV